eukprot:TRINITY_DN3047_c0_g1_i1.p1 TRINITY_DN3047_c0_g1~~TRINITY_DN3047_c0_g1_i1.p1  ORF type:complete len:638 (+),score=128.71 TRINITY_DN3047_c0_g1_i1:114-1916(+)
MSFPKSFSSLIILVCALLVAASIPTSVYAHTRWTFPVPRDNRADYKAGPCGAQVPGQGPSNTIQPGTLEVAWEETINHPGWFRIALSVAPDTGFDDLVLEDCIPHNSEGSTPRLYSMEVTIPDIDCTECALQIIQVMTDKPLINGKTQDYFSCSNIVITGTQSIEDFADDFSNQAESDCPAILNGDIDPDAPELEEGTEEEIACLEEVVGGLNNPVDLQYPEDDSNRIFVVEQTGTVRVLKHTPADDDGSNDIGEYKEESDPFIDVSSRMIELNPNYDERGLLGLSFHPKYKDNGKFYLFYSGTSLTNGGLVSRLSEFTQSDPSSNTASLQTEKTILEIPQPDTNHNGGQLLFGREDGFLYVSVGDGGGADDQFGNAQNTQSLMGKILRIDVDSPSGDLAYGIPSDNPFVKDDSYRGEIYALGLRNPWRCSFDREGDDNGDLYCGDVGQNRIESCVKIASGDNHGWPILEGTACLDAGCKPDPDFVLPFTEYSHDEGNSVIGGMMVRSPVPQLAEKYLFGDWTGKMWVYDFDAEERDPVVLRSQCAQTQGRIFGFGEGPSGEIYVLSTREASSTALNGAVHVFKQDGSRSSDASSSSMFR